MKKRTSGLKIVGIFTARKTYICSLNRFLKNKRCLSEMEEVIRRGDRYVRILYDDAASYMGGYNPTRAQVCAIKLCCYGRLEKTCKWPSRSQLPGYRDSDSQKNLPFLNKG